MDEYYQKHIDGVMASENLPPQLQLQLLKMAKYLLSGIPQDAQEQRDKILEHNKEYLEFENGTPRQWANIVQELKIQPKMAHMPDEILVRSKILHNLTRKPEEMNPNIEYVTVRFRVPESIYPDGEKFSETHPDMEGSFEKLLCTVGKRAGLTHDMPDSRVPHSFGIAKERFVGARKSVEIALQVKYADIPNAVEAMTSIIRELEKAPNPPGLK